MSLLLNILTQLGVDNTLWIQLVFFLVSYFFLSQFVFKPYMKNLEYRKKNTVGNAEEANKLNLAAEHLAMDYSGKVKAQNEKATSIYDQLKAQGQAEEDRLVSEARAEAAKLMGETKKKIQTDVRAAQEALKAQVPQLGRLIASRVLGRDLS